MTYTPVMAPQMSLANDFRACCINNWQRLVREGVPRDEARKIAEAIARFELLEKAPSSEQKQLISQFSRFVCRAQLWHSELLL
ncbi:MAG TPA: hypothetical protein V6D02_02185 [Candidatus Obscuribacterales bacterium]